MNRVTHMNQSYHTQRCSGLGTPRPRRDLKKIRIIFLKLQILGCGLCVCVCTHTHMVPYTHTHTIHNRHVHTIHNQDSRCDSTTETFLTARVSVVECVRHRQTDTHTHTHNPQPRCSSQLESWHTLVRTIEVCRSYECIMSPI